jgi:lipoate-protein ligase A
MNYLNLKTTDPAFNLAVEEYVFDYLPKDRMYVMLWQNDNAIIIGKNQNTLAEINEAYVKQQSIRVVRRLSGGGAVYHDMGNLNFTVIADAQGENLDFGRFCALVVKALQRVGVRAEINGRNDMTIDGKKFSGNAQYLRQGRVMHHGTILFDSDATKLSNALQVDEAKIQAKGVKSVRSRVTNVRPCLPVDMTLPQFRKILLDTILEEETGEEYVLTPKDLEIVEKLKRERYDTWEWNYGHSPACTLYKKGRVEGCGTVEAFIALREGKISQIVFRGDFFGISDPEQLAALLIGCRPDRDSLAEKLADMDVSRYFMGMTVSALLNILADS